MEVAKLSLFEKTPLALKREVKENKEKIIERKKNGEALLAISAAALATIAVAGLVIRNKHKQAQSVIKGGFQECNCVNTVMKNTDDAKFKSFNIAGPNANKSLLQASKSELSISDNPKKFQSDSLPLNNSIRSAANSDFSELSSTATSRMKIDEKNLDIFQDFYAANKARLNNENPGASSLFRKKRRAYMELRKEEPEILSLKKVNARVKNCWKSQKLIFPKQIILILLV